MRRIVIGLVAVAFTCACSSGYEPARSPRISMIMEGGLPTFVKNGKRYGSPVFGVGLVHAVQGNPRAEEQARIARNLEIGGFVFDMAGLASAFAGSGTAANAQASDKSQALGTTLLLGGLGAVIAGTIMTLCAQPHTYDAINIYNASVDPPH